MFEESTDMQILPEDDPTDITSKIIGHVGMIELNRPAKLNSLNGSMVRKITLSLRVG